MDLDTRETSENGVNLIFPSHGEFPQGRKNCNLPALTVLSREREQFNSNVVDTKKTCPLAKVKSEWRPLSYNWQNGRNWERGRRHSISGSRQGGPKMTSQPRELQPRAAMRNIFVSNHANEVASYKKWVSSPYSLANMHFFLENHEYIWTFLKQAESLIILSLALQFSGSGCIISIWSIAYFLT